MSEKVVSLIDGGPIQVDGQPDSDIVSVLERELERAKSGETRALAVFAFNAGERFRYEVTGNIQRSRLIGLLAVAQAEMVDSFNRSV